MTVAAVKKERNQSVELCRMVAALAVVFLHVPLPEPVGSWVGCLARFAVPFFFMVSGYYSLNQSCDWLKRRLVSVLKLNVYAALPYYIWKYLAFYRGSAGMEFLRAEVFPPNVLMDWLLRHVHPGAGHLWFLAALVPCYAGLWLYVRLREGKARNNQPLYLMGLFLMGTDFLLSTLLPVNGMAVPFMVYRNGWCLGLPLFLLGMFLHEYEDTIVEKFHLTTGKLILLTGAGILLSLIQYKSYGTSEIYLGTIPEMIGLMLLLTAHPVLPRPLGFLRWATPRFGRISTVVYIIHLLLLSAYEERFRVLAEARLGHWEAWARPFLIATASLIVAILWDWLLRRIKPQKPVKA